MYKKFFFIFVLFISLIHINIVDARIMTSEWDLRADYERLVSCGVLSTPFYGQRLWTAGAIAKELQGIKTEDFPEYCSLEEIQETLSRFEEFIKKQDYIIQKAKGSKPYLGLVESLSSSYFFLSGGSSPYPNNNRGQIDAVINTFRENTAGKVRGTGHTLAFSSEHEFAWKGQRLFLMPRFSFTFNNQLSAHRETLATVQQGYFLFDFWKLNAVLGRAPVIWDQGEYGGFLFSENARPLDHIQITNAQLFRLPWVFKYLGKWKLSVIFGNLGPEEFFSWGYFSGMSIGLKPTKNLEFNVSHIMQYGGEGSPSMSVGNWFQEFFGFIPMISQSAINSSNKISAIHMRYSFSRLMGMQLYFDYAMDDSNSGSARAYKKHFLHNSSYQGGIYFPRFLNSFRDTLRLEYTTTSHIANRHGTFANGWTINQNIIGDPLGSDGNRAKINWGHRWSDKTSSRLNLMWQGRESNVYTLSADNLDVIITTDGPEEDRFTFYWVQKINWNPWQVELGAGYEYIRNYQFVAGSSQSVGFILTGVKYIF